MPKRVATYRPHFLSRAKTTRAYESSASRLADKRFYASAAWLRLRNAFLAENPLCADCTREGRDVAAEHVHHLKERKDHPELALEWSNLQALCQRCHNSKRKRL